MIFLALFWEFFKTGLFSVGGGLATLPFLYDMGARTGWFTAMQVTDMLAVSESTPGPIGINMAVYTGYTTAGVLGSVCAVLGIVTPSIIVIMLVAALLKAFGENRYVRGAFYGIRPASTGLIAAAGLTVAAGVFLRRELWTGWESLPAVIDWAALALCGGTLIANMKFPKVHPAVFILAGAAAGVIFHLGGA